MKISEIVRFADRIAPFGLAAEWDNVGLLVGSGDSEVDRALIALDITPAVVEEAKKLKAGLIVSHHPVIFEPLRALEPSTAPYLLARYDIAALCLHTDLDRVFLIVTIILPETKLAFVDRFLVTCEAYGIRPIILINKVDLYTEPELQAQLADFKALYRGAGYEVLEISARKGTGLAAVRALCREGLTLFSGTSGVGKSSLLKALDPTLNPKIGEISLSHLQGKHTTTFYEMHPLTGGGFVIDTPGIRGFGLVDIAPEELSTYFPEMLRVMDNCRFKPCTHTHEPGCAVKQALEDSTVSPERYASYLGMLEEEHKYR